MDTRLRTTRTLKVTEVRPSAEEQEQLAQLRDDPRYEALLNVMERACISLETAHFNTSVGLPDEILGGHALTKGAWLFFTYVQKQVQNAYYTRTTSTEDEEREEEPSLDEVLQGFMGIPTQ